MHVPDDLILIDKTSGMTSFDVIRALRKRTGIKKWGHAGTLDPLATGLLILAHGSGTRNLTALIGLDKEYVAEVLIGESRTTGDLDGEIVEKVDVTELSENSVRGVLRTMCGTLRLPVSAYSAIKKQGVPMYKRARTAAQNGETIADVPIRDMQVLSAELLSIERKNNNVIAIIRFHVGSGTYIRSLAEELGRKLGYPATIKNLRRTKVGEFSIAEAWTLDEL